MRFLAIALATALVIGACSTQTDSVETAPGISDAAETPSAGDDATPVESDPTPAEATAEPVEEPTAVPGTRPDVDPASLLLSAAELPGWDFTGPMEFAAEPTFEASDCASMDQAWEAHAEPGTRVRASTDGLSLRQSVVSMTDGDVAAMVLDAVDVVWEQCVQLRYNGGMSWVEPVEVPPVDGWRTAGLAIGSEEGRVWIIGYWQRGSTIVFADLEGKGVWNTVNDLFALIGSRIGGEDAVALPATTPTPIGNEPPLLVPAPTPTSIPQPTPTARPVDSSYPRATDTWPDHELAHLAPTLEDLGPGWVYEDGSVNQAEPSDPDERMDGCDVEPPPTLGGFELSFEREGSSSDEFPDAISVIVGGPDDQGARALIQAFRGLGDCDLTEIGFAAGLEVLDLDIDGADDSLLMVGAVDDYAEFQIQIVLARFDGVIVGASRAMVVDEFSGPDQSVDVLVELIESMAAKR